MSASPATNLVPILRTCNADMTAYGGFTWPRSGFVDAPDWRPTHQCGNGLHGLLRGVGDAHHLSTEPEAVWMVVLADEAQCVDLSGKVKFPRAEVVFAGDKAGALAELVARGCDASQIVYSTLTGGDGSTLTGGVYSTLTGGVYSTLTGGEGSTLTGGEGSTLTGGDYSTLTGGVYSTLTGGVYSTLTGGEGSTLTGGVGSTIVVRYWNGEKYRIAAFQVGEDGIIAGQAYRCDAGGKLVAA